MCNITPVMTSNNSTTALPSATHSGQDAERSTLHDDSTDNQFQDIEKEKIEPTDAQVAGSTACSVGGDDFVEGGFEGWKAIFGCALVAASTVGEFLPLWHRSL